MANMSIGQVRFYTDMIMYQLSRGKTVSGSFAVLATSPGNNLVGIKSGGGTVDDLFDGRPSNLVTFDTKVTVASRADHVVINIDTGHADLLNSYVAILNHNMVSADAKMRVYSSDTAGDIDNENLGGTAMTCIEVVNGVPDANGDGNALVTPTTDGTTIIRFTEHHLRYIGIQFEGQSSNTFSSSNDLTVGGIMVGQYYDGSPVDINLTRSIDFDGVKVQDSIGGQRFSTMLNSGRQVSATSKAPFSTASSQMQVFGGRLKYDLTMSHVPSTDLMPTEYETYNAADDSFVEDVWNITNGPHLPFIFSCDNASIGANSESEHIYARFTNSSLNMQQIASNVFNFNLSIAEEF